MLAIASKVHVPSSDIHQFTAITKRSTKQVAADMAEEMRNDSQ